MTHMYSAGNTALYAALGVIFVLLLSAAAAGALLARKAQSERAKATLADANLRIKAWWVIFGVLGLAFALGKGATVLLFAVVSFCCLREFTGLTPSEKGDRPALFASFFLILPAQYLLIWHDWYGLYSVLIPVYGFILLPALALKGGTSGFLGRSAKMQWGVMLTVYCISHIPALLGLPPLKGQGAEQNPMLLALFLIVTVQLGDVFQYVWGKKYGKRKLAPSVSPSKTVEGLAGGCLSATVFGTFFSVFTPFPVWQAALLAAVLTLAGTLGGLVLSAVKRDFGVKDWGNSIAGHGGFMDRMDSLCFSAPLFFHLVRYFYT